MISLARLAVERAEAGLDVAFEVLEVPAWQWEIWWKDLMPLCPNRLDGPLERRRGNVIAIEIGKALDRCAEQSPDGRGLAWLRSGGSPLAYLPCCRRHCPMCVTEGKEAENV